MEWKGESVKMWPQVLNRPHADKVTAWQESSTFLPTVSFQLPCKSEHVTVMYEIIPP